MCFVINRAAERLKTGNRRLDAKRAVLHADALTETYVKPTHLLKKCLYGEHIVQKVVADIGLLSSSNCPGAFGHVWRDLDVHGDDFVDAGCGDDLYRRSQTLKEKLELVQKARFGRGYDSEATVLNRRVTYSDPGLTREADSRHADLAAAELGLQSARPKVSLGGAKPNAPLCHEELKPDGRSPPQRVSETGIPGIRPTRHRICLQGVQPRCRESNTC